MQSRLKRHGQTMGETVVDKPTVSIVPLLEDVVFNTQKKSHRAHRGQHSDALGTATLDGPIHPDHGTQWRL
jgi:hypothetical protein